MTRGVFIALTADFLIRGVAWEPFSEFTETRALRWEKPRKYCHGLGLARISEDP